MNDSHEHVCTNNAQHIAYSAKGWMVGEPCLVWVHGKPCGGTYVAVGTGARAANDASALVGS